MTEREPKYIHRLPPCPPYDISGTEQWLEEMAGKGYHLSPYDGFTFGIATFVVDTPKKVKYRLEPIRKGGSSVNGDEVPDEEAQDIYMEYGWHFVAQWRHFFVYRSVRDDARELHTDPGIQAMALKGVQKDLQHNLTSILFILVLNVVSRIFMGQSYPLLFVTMVNLGSLLVLGWIFWFLWMIVDLVRNAVLIKRIRTWLKSGGTVRKAPVKHERFYVQKRVIRWILFGVLLVVMISKMANSSEGEVSLADFNGEVPFATMNDLMSDGAYKLEHYGFGNTVQEWSDLAAPENYRWDEIASLTLPDGSKLEGSYDVYYHRTVSPFVAHILAQEYYLSEKFDKDFELLEIPELDVDFAVLYIGKYHYPTLILQDGTEVIRAEFWITETPTGGYSVSDWAITMAESILSNEVVS